MKNVLVTTKQGTGTGNFLTESVFLFAGKLCSCKLEFNQGQRKLTLSTSKRSIIKMSG